MGRLAAIMVCILGMAVLDHGLRLVWDIVGTGYVRGAGADAFLAAASAERRFIAIGEAVGVTFLYLCALRLSFPASLGGNRERWLCVLALALTAGRSFLGVGEGFSAPFGMVLVVCAGVALVIYNYLPKAPG